MSENLYNFLSKRGDYTKSYEDFESQFNNADSRAKLHSMMVQKGDYTKSLEEFNTQFFEINPETGEKFTFSEKARNIFEPVIPDFKNYEQRFNQTIYMGLDKALERATPKYLQPLVKGTSFDPSTLVDRMLYMGGAMDRPAEYTGTSDLNLNEIKEAFKYVKNPFNLSEEEKQDLAKIKFGNLNVVAKAVADEQKIMDKRMEDLGGYTGKGFFGSSGEDKVLAGIQALTGVVQTMVPAVLTQGRSLGPQIILPMVEDYNKEKAETLYGKDDPDALRKLGEDGGFELATPVVLGYASYALEKLQFGRITDYVKKQAFKPGRFAKLLTIGFKNGVEEGFQGVFEDLNTRLAKGESRTEAVANAFTDDLFSEKFLENYMMGVVGGTSLSAGGMAINRALKADEATSKKITEFIDVQSALRQALAATKEGTPEHEKHKKRLSIVEEEFKTFIQESNKLGEYLSLEQEEGLKSLIQEKDKNNKDLQELNRKLKDKVITQRQYDLAANEIKIEQAENDAAIMQIKTEANKTLLKKDLDSGGKFVGDIDGLEIESFDNQDEFFDALEAEYNKIGKKMPNYRDSNILINGLKIGGKFLVNNEVAAETNAVATSTHEVIHGVVKSTLQDNDGSGNLSAKGEKLVKSFINTLSAKELQLIENALEDGKYKVNEDGTGKEFKEYGEEYITIYGQLVKEGQLGKNALQKFGSWFTGVLNKETSFKKIKFEDGDSIKKFIDAFVKGDKEAVDRAKELAREGVKMKQEADPVFSVSKAKQNLNQYAKDKSGKFDKSMYDPNSPIIAKELGPMIKAQINNYFNKRPSLQVTPEGKEEMAQDVLFRLYNVSKKGVSDLNNFDGRGNLYGYLNGRIKYRMLDHFQSDNNIVPDFTKKELDEAKAELQDLTTDDVEPSKEKEVAVKEKILLETFGESDLQNEIREDVKIAGVTGVEKYLDFKKELVKHRKFTKDGTEITPELKAKLKDQGKEPLKELKSKRIPTGKYYFILEKVAASYGITDPIRLITEKDLDTKQRKAAQDKILSKRDEHIVSLPEGTTKAGDPTGIANTALGKAFFKAGGRTKFAETGTGKGLKEQAKQRIEPSNYLAIFGLIPKARVNNSSVDPAIRSQVIQTAVTAVRQAAQQEAKSLNLTKEAVDKYKDGKSNVMFSKSYVQDVLLKIKLGDIDNRNINNRNLYKTFIKEIYPKFVPLAKKKNGSPMLHTETFGNTSNIVTGKYITKDERKLLIIPANNTQLKNKTPFSKDQTNAINEVMKKTDFFDQKNFNNELRKQGAEIFIKGLNEAVNGKGGNINNLKPISMLLIGQSNAGTGHVARTMARGLGVSNTGTLSKKEHVLVANNAVDIIVESLAKNNVDLVLPWLLDNYYQINLNAQQDALVDNAYEDSDKKMPPVFYENLNKAIDAKDMSLASDPIIRYTMANVNLSEINWHTGGTLLQHIDNKYGFDGALSYGNNSETSVQEVNRILTEFFAKRADKKTTKKAIENIADVKFSKTINSNKTLNNAISFSRSAKNPTRGITILDFDDTLATTKSLVKFTAPDGTTGTLNAEQFASTYQDLQDQGYTFDFSDFNKVVKGKLAPLFQKALKLQNKFGPENMFVLTARPPASQKAIFDFLKANGLNIPLKNITGLGNSTSEAKALWVADKVAEGYNDFYFADDALQNVQAVKNMLDQFDVKSKVQQAKVKFSKSMDKDFNKILQDVTGIEFKKRFSDIKARKRGASKGKFRFFVPPSHEDFVGLLYNFMGKGRKGDQHRDFFEKALVRPLNRAYREIDTAKQAIANDYKALNKQFDGIKKKLRKKTPDGDFIFEDAIRIYLWNKHGYEIPGLSPTDQKNLVELVNNDAELKAYADAINIISKQDTYVDPGKGWEGGNIKTDLIDATGRVGREQYFAEFKENADIIFSPENLNKIEAAYGKDFRSALEDMLYRISTGVNRPKGQSGTTNKFMNYLNGSVGTVMFFNVRSAILQQMSIVNYINFADNNIFAAAKAFANQKQYWKDFAFIFNSDMLKQRRGGIGTDINGADLAQAVQGSKDPTKVVISRLLQLGFLPTQIGDNIAIATGGATFYRNRINKYIKDGLSQKEAEAKAFTDFQDITQSTQQSSRPDMTSQQQASWIGKLVLNFQNITSQYNRIIKKAALDIKNGRISPPYTTRTQSNLGNLSKILYYGGIQNVIFYSLQTALFAVMFDDDNDEDQILKKSERVINGSIDSILRGAGIYGAVASTLKNAVIKWKEQREPNYNKDESGVLMELLNFSPVVGIKARQIVNAEKTLNYNENIISEMETFDAENPGWSAVTNYTQALTNFPANRLYQKTLNMRNALDKDYTNFQRVMFFSGYTTWSLGLGDSEAIINAKEKVKINKKNSKKKKPKKGFKGFTVPQNVW